VWDVPGWLGAGMTEAQILDEHPGLEAADFAEVCSYARLITRLDTLFPGLPHVRDLGLRQARGPKIHLARCERPLRVIENLLRHHLIRIAEFEQSPFSAVLLPGGP
jgi:hypothetical protein